MTRDAREMFRRWRRSEIDAAIECVGFGAVAVAVLFALVVLCGVFAGGCVPYKPVAISDTASRPPPRDFYREARERRESKDVRDSLRKIEANTGARP